MSQNNDSSVLRLWRETARSRGRLVLATDNELEGFLEFVSGSDSGLAARIAAELALRAWLGRRGEPWPEGLASEEICPPEVAGSIRRWLAGRLENPQAGLSPPEAAAASRQSALLRHLNNAVRRWKEADAFVPLVARHPAGTTGALPPAAAAPFHLEVLHNRNAPPVVVENASRPERRAIEGLIPAWRDAWNAALRCGFIHEGQGLMAVFSDLGEEDARIPRGRSAVAPFFLAMALRHLGINPPAWTWIASGSFDSKSLRPPSPHPGDPEWKAKSQLAESFAILESWRFLPDSWPSAEPGEWKALLRERFGEFADNADFKQIESGLERIDRAMHEGIPNFDDILASLERTLNSILPTGNKQVSPRRQRIKSRATLLKADALCHMGRPDEALDLIETQQGLVAGYQGCRALLRNAVACADQARFSEALSALEKANERCTDLDPLEQTMIRRDVLGTRGQTLIARALETGDPEDRRNALADLREALELTRILDDERPAGQSAEESRNLCYVLLWHAFFEPESADTGELFRQTMESARRSGADPAFILRAAHLAAYRAHLGGLALPLPWWPEQGVPLPEARSWVAATARKYRAAVAAVQGDADQASALFEEALRILDGAPGLLSFIRATILLQAAESLAHSQPEPARRHLEEAESAFARHVQANTLDPGSPVAPGRWLDFIRRMKENPECPGASSPQRLFQY